MSQFKEEVSPLLTIGRREHVDFPEWHLFHVRAKVDTGAYSSALDVASYRLVETPERLYVELHWVARRRQPQAIQTVRTPVVGFTTVRSSNGNRQRRPVIQALVRLGPLQRPIRLTLTDRSAMRCRMLLGRQALAGAFLVDVQSKDLLASRYPQQASAT